MILYSSRRRESPSSSILRSSIEYSTRWLRRLSATLCEAGHQTILHLSAISFSFSTYIHSVNRVDLLVIKSFVSSLHESNGQCLHLTRSALRSHSISQVTRHRSHANLVKHPPQMPIHHPHQMRHPSQREPACNHGQYGTNAQKQW